MNSALTIGRLTVHAFTRYVRTPAGAKRYGVPIGSPIPVGRRVRKSSGGKGAKGAPAAPGRSADAPRVQLTPAQVDLAERHFGRTADTNGKERGARLHPDGTLEVVDAGRARASLDRVAANPDTPPERQQAARELRDKIPGAPDKPEPETPAEPKSTPVRAVSEKGLADDYRNRVTLSGAERETLDRYTTSRFAGINRKLRGQPRNEDQDGTPEEVESDIANLDELMSRYRTPGTFTAFRGIGAGLIPGGDATGKVVTADGYSSTALDKPTGRFDNLPNMLEITVPQGMSGVAVNGTDSGFQDEREFILPHGTRFRIDADETRQRPGGWGPQRYLRVTALPPLPDGNVTP